MELTELDGIGKSTAKLLQEAGVFSPEDLAGMDEGLVVPGISADRLAELQDRALTIFCVEEPPDDEAEEVEQQGVGSELEELEEPPEPSEPEEPKEPEETPIEFQYKRLTFHGMVGHPEVGELEIQKWLFKVDEPQVVPVNIAEMILSRKQYLFKVEDATGS